MGLIIEKNIIILFLLLLVKITVNNAHAAPYNNNDNNNGNNNITYNNTNIKYYTITIRPFIENASSLTLVLDENEYKKYGIDKNETTVINGKNSLQIENKTRKIDNIDNDDDKIDAKEFVVISNNENLEGSNNIPKTYSVVQDWHLVCKQLCGASLGGPTCGEPTCEQIKKEASQKYNITKKANQLLEDKSDEICQDLCQHQLGHDICDCGKRILLIDNFSETDSDSLLLGRNQICHSFCKHNDITITGCSICSRDIDDYEKDISSITETVQTKLIPTTPNWAKICKELCKSGDGGSLCNCDKPPFF